MPYPVWGGDPGDVAEYLEQDDVLAAHGLTRPAWMAYGACRGSSVEFVPEYVEHLGQRVPDVRKARKAVPRCPGCGRAISPKAAACNRCAGRHRALAAEYPALTLDAALVVATVPMSRTLEGPLGDPLDAAYTAARAVCAACTVAGPCLAYALADADLVGCWGGTSDTERRALRAQ